MPYYRVYYPRARHRPRRRYGRGGAMGAPAAVVVGAALALAVSTSGHATAHHRHHPHGVHVVAAPHAAQVAIRYAEHQLRCPYAWGGTGPCDAGFDCSGLVMMAWRAAGVNIARTSQDQWRTLPHITREELRPGDLVFKAGGDGTVTSPGHVVMYIGRGKVIQAYATGYPVEISSLASVSASGLTGYARP